MSKANQTKTKNVSDPINEAQAEVKEAQAKLAEAIKRVQAEKKKRAEEEEEAQAKLKEAEKRNRVEEERRAELERQQGVRQADEERRQKEAAAKSVPQTQKRPISAPHVHTDGKAPQSKGKGKMANNKRKHEETSDEDSDGLAKEKVDAADAVKRQKRKSLVLHATVASNSGLTVWPLTAVKRAQTATGPNARVAGSEMSAATSSAPPKEVRQVPSKSPVPQVKQVASNSGTRNSLPKLSTPSRPLTNSNPSLKPSFKPSAPPNALHPSTLLPPPAAVAGPSNLPNAKNKSVSPSTNQDSSDYSESSMGKELHCLRLSLSEANGAILRLTLDFTHELTVIRRQNAAIEDQNNRILQGIRWLESELAERMGPPLSQEDRDEEDEDMDVAEEA
ncbi:hypothetical protein BT96DRAFT_945931 [Gymnopus androsaceus JB14]|uniref:Uncharacterized protein n=1 Tax=Gymnopus androsaceus JB14 TaxID=1447944 RepID=A0A6A4GZ10_9AGAR|nr:hypothetical protein BT96DRAFT_945931 [Gymnopus androsaceus JB14]